MTQSEGTPPVAQPSLSINKRNWVEHGEFVTYILAEISENINFRLYLFSSRVSFEPSIFNILQQQLNTHNILSNTYTCEHRVVRTKVVRSIFVQWNTSVQRVGGMEFVTWKSKSFSIMRYKNVSTRRPIEQNNPAEFRVVPHIKFGSAHNSVPIWHGACHIQPHWVCGIHGNSRRCGVGESMCSMCVAWWCYTEKKSSKSTTQHVSLLYTNGISVLLLDYTNPLQCWSIQ